MYKKFNNLRKTIESTPMDPIFIGEQKVDKVSIKKTSFNSKNFQLEYLDSFNNIMDLEENMVQWLDVIGLHDEEIIKNICQDLNLHPLTIEDILNMSQNPKIEQYDDYIFLATKNMFLNSKGHVETEQIYFILKDNTLVSLKENNTDIFDNFNKRLKDGSTIRRYGSDILLYSLLDTIVDNYFIVIGDIGSEIDTIEDELLNNPDKELLQDIYEIKRDLIYMRNILWPMRNIISGLSKTDFEDISNNSVVYFRDVYDHIIQMIDITETYRDICSGMLDTYLSSIGNKTNDVMKVLTVFSTISVPLTFLTGVYGMNFKYQPELHWRYAYPVFWLMSIGITILMLYYFRKKDWL